MRLCENTKRRGGDALLGAAGSVGGYRFVVNDYFDRAEPADLNPNGGEPIAATAVVTGSARALGSAEQPSLPIAQVIMSVGEASAKGVDGLTVWLRPDSPVYENDLVETGAGATLGLVTQNGNMIVLDENTRFVLAPEIQSKDDGGEKLALLSGNLVFVNRPDHDEFALQLHIGTATARLNVEGAGTVGQLTFRGGLGEVVLHPSYDGAVGSIRIESQGNVLQLNHPFASARFGDGIAGVSFDAGTGADLSFASWLPFFQITAAGSAGDETPTDTFIDVTGDFKADSSDGGEIVVTASDTPPGPSPAQFTAETTRDDEMVADEISAPVPADVFILPSMPNDFAQFTDQTPGGVGTLAAALLGGLPDLPIVSNSVIFVGDLDPSAAFFGGIDLGTVAGVPFTLGNGVLITSGEAPPGFINTVPDFTFTAGLVGDADLDALLIENGLPGNTTDSTSLTFTVNATPETHAILFAVVFATEEFPEGFAGDIAGIFVDGENYLFFPDGALVRHEPGTSDRNLVDNSQNLTGGLSPLSTEYDAVSRPAIIAAVFDPNETSHTIRVAISDTGDQARDSGLFLATLGIIGDDTLGGQGDDTLAGSNADDTVIGGAGADLIFGLGAADNLDGGDGADTLNGGVGADSLNGGPGADLLQGSVGDDVLNGGLDTDTLNGGLGNDVLVGDAGNDVLDGASGVDTAAYATATAGVFADLIQSTVTGNVSVGADLLIEIENVLGSDHDDTVTGDDLSNVLDGASGGDLLDGGTGNDTLLGGGGDDTLISGLGNNELSGGTGDDTVDYTAAMAAVLADLSVGMATAGVAVDALAEIENLVGSDFADELTGDGATNLLDGAAGDDLLDGGGGDDSLRGGAGADTLIGGVGNDDLDGGEGFDIADYRSSGSAVMASLTLGAVVLALESDTLGDIEALFGSDHNDELSGDGGANLIEGNDGDDTVDGGGGADTLDGGDGIDTVTFAAAGQSVTASLASQSASSGGASISVFGFENLEGSAFADVLTGDGLANSLSGLAGNDFISGGVGADTVEGGTGNDTLDGGAGSDVFSGGGGNDTASFSAAVTASLVTGVAVDGSGGVDVLTGIENLTGSNFNDDLVGGAGVNLLLGLDGDDTLDGGDGNDTLDGGSGDDDLDGGEGFDIVDYRSSGSAVMASLTLGAVVLALESDTLGDIEALFGSDHNDELSGDGGANLIEGNDGDDTVDGGGGADTLDGGDGIDTVTFAAAGQSVTASLASQSASSGGASISVFGFENLEGSAFADVLTGDGLANSLSGLAGNDFISGGVGADTVEGGTGNDTLDGGAGSDVFSGGGGNDTASFSAAVTASLVTGVAVDGSGGVDVLTGIENLTGSNFNDDLVGGAGVNLLLGLDGDDTLDGGDGNDTLDGGAGDDDLDGGEGVDTASFSGADGGVDASLLDETASALVGNGGTDTLRNIENLLGSDFADRLAGDANDNQLQGGAGNDLLDGAGGTDTASYAAAATSGVFVDLTQSTAVGNASVGADLLIEIENVLGSTRDDSITGDGLSNVLDGASGGDLLDGGAGNDSLLGGGGDDTLIGGLGSNELFGGTGGDTADYTAAIAAVLADLSAGMATAGVVVDALAGIENLVGSDFADELTGDGANNLLEGVGGDDLLDGDVGDDNLRGGAGADTLFGGIGNDTLDGGAESDVLNGGDGTDTASFDAAVSASLVTGVATDGSGGVDVLTGIENLTGSNFGDDLVGDAGANSLLGLDGDDTLDGGDGNDTLAGSNGSDTLDCDGGVDTASFSGADGGVDASLLDETASALAGNGGTDTLLNIESLLGSDFADRLAGDANDNQLHGGAGDDTLDGDAGNDTLDGGAGRDTLIGGAGADDFLLFDLSGSGGQATDVVGDFTMGMDRLLTDFPVGGMLTGSGLIFDMGVLTEKSFSLIDEVYDGTNGTSESYEAKTGSIIFDSEGSLIYDPNGDEAGYTVVAEIEGDPVAADDIILV